MFKSLLSACSIAILVLPSIAFSTRTRCPVKEPETLLSLYRNSDAIYVARFDGTEELAKAEDAAGDFIIDSRKLFAVSSTLKGEDRKLIALDEQEFRSKFDRSSESTEMPVEENEDEIDSLYRRPKLQTGDTVLLFLKLSPQESGEATLGLTDYRDAIKKLSGERLDAYQARIRELNSIFGDKNKAATPAIVDWLVKTALDPLTRWEGAFELQQSYEQMRWQEEQNEGVEEGGSDVEEIQSDNEQPDVDLVVNIKEKGEQQISINGVSVTRVVTDEAASQEDSEEIGAETETEETPEEFDTSAYARLMTDAQKEALTNALVASASEGTPVGTKMKPMSEGDKALIELVSKWGDSRLAKYLLQQMQAFGQDPYVVYRLMTTTTSVLEDEELEQISTKYGEVYYEDGDSFVDKGDMEKEAVDNDADENEAATEVEEGSGDADRAASDEAEVVQQSGDEAEQAHRVTYGELRAELVWKFVARSAAVIAVAEAKEVAKPDH